MIFFKNFLMPLNSMVSRTLMNTLYLVTSCWGAYPDSLKAFKKLVNPKISTLLFIFSFYTSMLFAQAANSTDSIANDSTITFLQEFTVTGTNIIHYSDKDVVRITKDMRKGCFTIGETLGKIPGIIYSRFTKSLSYYGQENVIILVDSLKKNDEYIKGLHHMRFDKVDIIPYPKGKLVMI